MTLDVARLYGERFTRQEIERRNRLWQTLCSAYFQQFVPTKSTVLDVGAGYCEFINNIRAGRKYAVDLNEDTRRFAASGVEVFVCSAKNLDFLEPNSVDVTFVSNLLEHLSTKEEIMEVLTEIRRVSKPSGYVLLLQPNIRYLSGEYWDFFDHRIPLTDRSLVEAMSVAGFQIDKVVPRFLPYTTKGYLPSSPWAVRLYLRIPLAWWILGKQTLVIGTSRLPQQNGRCQVGQWQG